MKTTAPDDAFGGTGIKTCVHIENGDNELTWEAFLKMALENKAVIEPVSKNGETLYMVQFLDEPQATWTETEIRARLQAGIHLPFYLEPAFRPDKKGFACKSCLVVTQKAIDQGEAAFRNLVQMIGDKDVYHKLDILVRIIPDENPNVPYMVRQELIELDQLAQRFGFDE